MQRMTQPHAVQHVADALTGTTTGSQRQPKGVLEPVARAIQLALPPERREHPLSELAGRRLARASPITAGNNCHHRAPNTATGVGDRGAGGDLADPAVPAARGRLRQGSEFINHHLLHWCEQRKLTFTRSRPGNSNDGAHVEQKNWAVVRTVVGYHRYDTAAELLLLNKIWVLQSQITNFFLPQQKLIS